MYFSRFPLIEYEFEINGKVERRVVRDITTNIRVRKEVLENVTIYDEYDIRDGETPEIIAAKVYGSSMYHWVVMLCNQRYDYDADFPLTDRQLDQYLADKYGSDLYDVHHYVDTRGYVVMSDVIGSVPVTNYDYEVNINESKRRIKLIAPSLLANIIAQFKALI